jgi:hypothetical protein
MPHPSRVYLNLGESADPTIYIWALVWWPFSFIHHLNPFFPRIVYAPTSYNLAWATTIPGPSLLAYPITRWVGPIITYNVLRLLAPACAGWTAFLLCPHITRRFWPSLLGGYVFGFSSYMICETHGHLFLILIFSAPVYGAAGSAGDGAKDQQVQFHHATRAFAHFSIPHFCGALRHHDCDWCVGYSVRSADLAIGAKARAMA